MSTTKLAKAISVFIIMAAVSLAAQKQAVGKERPRNGMDVSEGMSPEGMSCEKWKAKSKKDFLAIVSDARAAQARAKKIQAKILVDFRAAMKAAGPYDGGYDEAMAAQAQMEKVLARDLPKDAVCKKTEVYRAASGRARAKYLCDLSPDRSEQVLLTLNQPDDVDGKPAQASVDIDWIKGSQTPLQASPPDGERYTRLVGQLVGQSVPATAGKDGKPTQDLYIRIVKGSNPGHEVELLNCGNCTPEQYVEAMEKLNLDCRMDELAGCKNDVPSDFGSRTGDRSPEAAVMDPETTRPGKKSSKVPNLIHRTSDSGLRSVI